MSDQVRDVRRPGHYWADNEIVDDYLPAIGLYGFAVYMLLCKYADASGRCFPAIPTMAKKLGISKPTILKAIATLKQAKLIAVEPRAVNGKTTTNEYQLLSIDKDKLRGQPALPLHMEGVKDVDARGKPDLLLGVKDVDPNNTHIEEDPQKKSLSPVANAPVESAPQPKPEPEREPAIDALMVSISSEPESPAPPPHPPGHYALVDGTLTGPFNNYNAARKFAPTGTISQTPPRDAVAVPPAKPGRKEKADKPVKPKLPAIYSSPALYDAIGAFSFGGGDAADLEPHRARIGVIRKALAKYVCDKLGREPNADEIAAVVANVVAMPGEYRRRFKDREIAKGASTFMDAYKELFKNGNGTGNGYKFIWHDTEWEVHEGRVHVEIKPGIFRNIPPSPDYWQSFLEEMEREEKQRADYARK